MRQFVRFLALALIVLTLVNNHTLTYASLARTQAQGQPGPGKKFVATPFGPIEVDASDPRPAVAVGPAVAPTTPPAPVPGAALAAPPPAQAAPAQAQGDPE